MLNPSTACGVTNDLTTIRCINFAKKWGYGGISIGNIYPFRAKRPKDLRKWLKNSGDLYDFNECEFNQAHVDQMAACADLVVCAWGCNHPGTPDWIKDIYTKDGSLNYLELCKDGKTPKHPLGNISKNAFPRETDLDIWG